MAGKHFEFDKALDLRLDSSKLYSIAGLWTARVCADHFEDVLIVEPDELVESKQIDHGNSASLDLRGPTRKRVVQYLSAHGKYLSFLELALHISLS